MAESSNNEQIVSKAEPFFPNGFEEWQETHFEVSSRIGIAIDRDNAPNRLKEMFLEVGTGGLWELAKSLTDKFETQNVGIAWGEERDYYETIDAFLEQELN